MYKSTTVLLMEAEDESSAFSFTVGRVYNRRDDLHARFGGQQQGGISTPATHPVVFLFTSETGGEFGYRDEFRPDGTFWYTGEGQRGDMEMIRGNRAIREHRSQGDQLHLFEAIGNGNVRYLGQAWYLDHHDEDRPDADGNMRTAIVFGWLSNSGKVKRKGPVNQQRVTTMVPPENGGHAQWMS